MTMTEEIDVAICTNLAPNHLDMHKDMQEYINAKKNIFLYQSSNGILILNRENEITHEFKKEAKGIVREFSSKREIDRWMHIIKMERFILREKKCAKKII